MRRISTELRPGILDHLGLAAAVEWAAEEFQSRTGILCQLSLPGADLAIGAELATAFFRIFQEALTNIARHAGATRVSVSLSQQNGDVLLEVCDNGRGIRPDQHPGPKVARHPGNARTHSAAGRRVLYRRRSRRRNHGTRPHSRCRSAAVGGQPVIRILIADDHAVVRRGVKEILEHEFEGAVYGEAKDAAGILNLIRDADWDLAILDIGLPGRSGVDVLRDVKAARPKLPVLVLSMYPEDQYAKRILKTGASGYVNKESAAEELVIAVRKVLAGGRYVSAALAERLASDLSQNDERPKHEALSDRELEVLRMIGVGKTVGQIAEELHLGATTVSTYRARILEKMTMTTTAELMRYALQNHLVD